MSLSGNTTLLQNLLSEVNSLPMENNQSKTVIPSASQQVVSYDSGYTGLEQVTVTGDANLTAGNVKSGVAIFGKTGTFTSDANATASDILSGKTAYVDGVKVTGSFASQTKTVTANGTYTPSSGKYFSSVTVSIPVYDGTVVG